MGQESARLTTQRDSAPHSIIRIPNELLLIIISPMEVRYQLALLRTCRLLYAYCKNSTVTMAYGSQVNFSRRNGSIKALHLHINRNGWAPFEFTRIPKFWSNEPSKVVLCLDETFNMPKKLNLASVNGSITISPKVKLIPNSSFFREFLLQ